MARIDNLQHFLTDVADAIRAKTGNTSKLSPVNFDTEIANITSSSVPTLAGIYVKECGKTSYAEGEVFSLEGYVIEAVYSDGTVSDVTTNCVYYSEPLTLDDNEVWVVFVDDDITRSLMQPITVVVAQVINYTMLYDLGKEHTDLTGGWTGKITGGLSTYKYYNQMTKEVESFSCVTAGLSMYSIVTTNAIDVAPYTMAGFCFTHASGEYASIVSDLYMLNVGHYVNSSTIKNEVRVPHNTIPAFKKDYRYNVITNKDELCYFAVTQGSDGSGTSNLSYYHNVFLVKEDNWQPINDLAMTDITSANDVTASQAMSLMSSTDALTYLAKNCTGDFMIQLLKNINFANQFIGHANAYILLENEHWAKFINMSYLYETT